MAKANVYTIPKNRQSEVWDHFTGEGSFAYCNYCARQVKYCGGTSNFKNHLKRCLGRGNIAGLTTQRMDEMNQDSLDSVEIVPDPRELVTVTSDEPKAGFKRRIGQTELTLIKPSKKSKPHGEFSEHTIFAGTLTQPTNLDDSVEVLSDDDGESASLNEENSHESAESQRIRLIPKRLPPLPKMSKIDRPPEKKQDAIWVRSNMNIQKAKTLVPPPHDHLRSFFKAMEDLVRNFSPLQQADAKNQIYSLVSRIEMKNLLSNQCQSENSSANQSPIRQVSPIPSPQNLPEPAKANGDVQPALEQSNGKEIDL